MIDKYETPQGTVIINVDTPRIIIALSSGFDSALLLYMTALAARKYNPTLKIYPITVRRANNYTTPVHKAIHDRVDNYANAIKVVEWVRSCFPEIDIHDNLLYDSYFWNYCGDDPIMGTSHTYVVAMRSLISYVLSLPLGGIHDHAYDTIILNGVTKNPEFELGGFNPEIHRNSKLKIDNEKILTIQTNNIVKSQNSIIKVLECESFRNGDKRVTFWIADVLGILDNLLKITRSCEGNRELTNNWTEECHHCWWCYERTWAQETYKDQQPYDHDKYKSPDYFNALKD